MKTAKTMDAIKQHAFSNDKTQLKQNNFNFHSNLLLPLFLFVSSCFQFAKRFQFYFKNFHENAFHFPSNRENDEMLFGMNKELGWVKNKCKKSDSALLN